MIYPIEVIVVFLISSFYLGWHVRKQFTSKKGCSKCNCGE